MGKFVYVGLAFMLLGVVQLYQLDWSGATIPFLSPAAATTGTPASVSQVGTPAAVELPETDLSTWFAGAAAESDVSAETQKWLDIAGALAIAGTPAGWASVCSEASKAAGADRASEPLLGALACSSDLTVTALQQFAVSLLAARSEVVLLARGIPGHGEASAGAWFSEIRGACTNGLPSRQGADSAYAEACSLALAGLDTQPIAWPVREEALASAYAAVAADLASRDATIEAEPPKVEAPDDGELGSDSDPEPTPAP